MRTVDINSDCGESFGNWRLGDDEALIPLITAANVACGFHGGDPLTMIRTVELCAASGVQVGSHPGFPDLLGFGRRTMRLSPEDGYAYVLYQTGALKAILAARGLELHHVKPHGAFYTVLRTEEELAAAVCEAIVKLMPRPLAYWPDSTDAAFTRAAARVGIRVVREVYPDLSYSPEGEVIIQRAKQLTDIDFAAAQVRLWLDEGRVLAVDGTKVPLDAESICIHGDGPNAIEVAHAVRRTIVDCGCVVGALIPA